MMRTRRGLLLKQKVKKQVGSIISFTLILCVKLWLKLNGRQIRIQKTSESSAKVHFIGLLSRSTTSIRQINSHDLGRHCLLFEGVQVLSDQQNEIENSANSSDSQNRDSDVNIFSSSSLSSITFNESSKSSGRSTVTMEIGFDNSEETEKWLRITQDLIN
jgi:hypothetical protein